MQITRTLMCALFASAVLAGADVADDFYQAIRRDDSAAVSALTKRDNKWKAPTWPSKRPPAGPLDAGLVPFITDQHCIRQFGTVPSWHTFRIARGTWMFAYET